MSRIDETIQAKKEKRQKLEELGVLVHPYSFEKKHSVTQAREMLDQAVTTAGRIRAIRGHGKLAFFDIQDTTGNIQVMVRQDGVGEESFKLIQYIDAGDFLGISGTVTTSKTGEVTIMAQQLTFLGKSLRPLPTEWNASDDKEVRFRKRYLDMMVSPEVKRVLDSRWLIEKELRRYLQDEHNFVEVETPVFQPLYGGTNAKPFSTHMNALDCDYYLRLAPELYLKRLIVGGYERIFEIARNFRNEGIDQTHQPEFTMIEWYETYADYHRMMDVAEGLIKHLVKKLHGGTTLQVGEHTVDVGPQWPRITMTEALQQYTSIDFDNSSDDQLQQLLEQHQINLIGEFTRGKALFSLFDKLVTDHLIDPIWIVDYPRDVSPLSKLHRTKPGFAERFEAYIGGKELADGWSEITDPIDQRNIFEGEQKRMRAGDTEAHPLDEDFLEAMEYGMPPLGGIGMGIDRLVMFLTNTWSIREVIAFPTLRPLHPRKVTAAAAVKGSHSPRVTGIDPKVNEKFPGIFFAQVIIKNVSIQKSDETLEQLKTEITDTKKDLSVEEIQELTPIKAYRELFKATGVDFHKNRPSPEALLRRVSSGKGVYNINTAVDAYNLAVIESGVGLGGFDAASLKLPVALRFSVAGESMMLLGDDQPTLTREGQLVYADQNQPITIDLNHRDISATKITEKTTQIALFADGAPGLDRGQVVAALQRGAQLIQQFCGGEIGTIEVIDAQTPPPPTSGNNSSGTLPSREQSEKLLQEYITNPALQHHSHMVAQAMEAYAKELGEDTELWYQAGLLHDLDWEKYPDEHPNKAINEILTAYPQVLRDAIAAHAPERTGKEPETTIEKYLYACDEISGFMHAVSLMRPDGFKGMEPKSIKKKLKDKSFAANVSRDDIEKGLQLIGKTADEHLSFLINVFSS